MRDEVSKEKMARLPKWARDRIELLQRDVAHYQAKLAQGPDDSVVFADPFSDAPRPLGDADIEFRFGEGTDEKFKVRIDKNVLEVYGGDSLIVLPQSSNVIRVEIRKWY